MLTRQHHHKLVPNVAVHPHRSLRQSFKKGWEVPPDGGSDDTPQDQGVATDIGRAFEGAAAGKSMAAFSDEQVGLPYGLVSQVGLILAHGGIVGYFLWVW